MGKYCASPLGGLHFRCNKDFSKGFNHFLKPDLVQYYIRKRLFTAGPRAFHICLFCSANQSALILTSIQISLKIAKLNFHPFSGRTHAFVWQLNPPWIIRWIMGGLLIGNETLSTKKHKNHLFGSSDRATQPQEFINIS